MVNRIQYIDSAKGLCIILVVFMHVQCAFPGFEYPLDDFFITFRMPLYFLLSGLFFKRYESFIGFVKRKTNKLLIPFLFFYLLTSVLMPNLFNWLGYDIQHAHSLGWKSILNIVNVYDFFNAPIWFLLCLFWVNIYFYIIDSIATFYPKSQVIGIVVLSCFCGYLGYELGCNDYHLMPYFDTAFTAVPFFCCGYLLRKYTNILEANRFDNYLLLWVLLAFVATYILAAPVFFQRNDYSQSSFFALYVGGICGSLGILFLAKMIGKISLISYWGRYSIMVLCTHQVVLQVLKTIYAKIEYVTTLSPYLLVPFTLCIIMCSYLVIIPFMKKYLPYVTAQKDVILINQ